MSKDNRLYTFLIAPTRSSRVRQFSIHHNVLYVVGGCLVALLALTVYGATRLAQTEAINFSNLALKAENARLKEENDAFQNSYGKLKGQISYIEDMSR
ncbi:MAG TPA: hypothetical protein VNI02_25270, partial [Blastocatellia bacterium]|nr:hypothetical protein [Blastocatellia bacterium]